MMQELLWLPLLISLSGAVAAFAHYWSGLEKHITPVTLAWGLALWPLSIFVLLVGWVGRVGSEPLTWSAAWLPTFDLTLSLYADSLSVLFGLLVSGIGTLIVVYGGYYFQHEQGIGRFFGYILLFMTAMLGLVLAGDVLTLFIFWEGTSITSFLLVAYKYKYEDARKGAFRALFITGGGGIALLAGLLMVAYVAGGTDWQTVLSSGDLLRGNWLYPVMLGLVALGAFTKSAQFPAHIWLPGAMSAPTPASAYLHSATMVKAGIYLLARINPALGLTESWFWLLTIFGGVTMVFGAYMGIKQNDLKALLAYSTISQLGILTMLLGQDTDKAFKALVIGIVAHALFKSALFMTAGIIDHETGTRDIRKLGGMWRKMPFTFGVVAIAALSMAGLPPMFGFLAKETLLATAVHPSLPVALAWLLPTIVVAAGAMKMVQSGLVVVDGFLGKPKSEHAQKAHEAPWPMWLAPAVPALISLGFGVLPEPPAVATFFADAAGVAYGGEVEVSFALWTGLNIPLYLSMVTIGLGVGLLLIRHRLRAAQNRWHQADVLNEKVYGGTLRGIDKAAEWATWLQHGHLRVYLNIMLVTTAALVFGFGGWYWPTPTFEWPTLTVGTELEYLRLFALMLTAVAAIASVTLLRDFFAIMALGVAGFGVAVFMILEPAPDVTLVQIVVDILAVVILVLALTRIPRSQRRRAQSISLTQQTWRDVRDWLVAGSVGLVVTMVTWTALSTRPRESVVTPFFEQNAKPLANAADIVGAIVVDFRAFDTFIEIAVFGMAGLGILTLLRHATKKWPVEEIEEEVAFKTGALLTQGIGGEQTSPFLQVVAQIVLPVSLVIGVVHMMYGHDQPGDGFTAGVIISLGVGLWYVVFGYHGTRERLPWLRPQVLIGVGLLIPVLTGITAAVSVGSFFAPVDYGGMIGLRLPAGFYLSSAFLFEVAICLTVLGSVAMMLNTLGRPQTVFSKAQERAEAEPLEPAVDQQPAVGD